MSLPLPSNCGNSMDAAPSIRNAAMGATKRCHARAYCGPPRQPSARSRSTPNPRWALQSMPNRLPTGTRRRRESDMSAHWVVRATKHLRQWPTPVAPAISAAARALRVGLLGRKAHLQMAHRKPPPYGLAVWVSYSYPCCAAASMTVHCAINVRNGITDIVYRTIPNSSCTLAFPNRCVVPVTIH